MIVIDWTRKINDIWWNTPIQTVHEWVDAYGGEYFENHKPDGFDYIVFDNDHDALVFKLTFGL
jgi:hypothetical protein